MGDHEPGIRNDAAPWADFDAEGYSKANYATVFPEDAEIIRYASDFLVHACRSRPRVRRGVDVGAGPNLYPSLLMLPWVEHIVFTEYARSNIEWLTINLPDSGGDWIWQDFWDLMADLPGYADIEQPRRRLAACHEIVFSSVFDLPPRTWDLGTMFFVADGLSADEAEFETAVRRFLEALRPESPFLMAFMEGSTGYEVSNVEFPAVTLSADSLGSLLRELPVTGTSVLRTDRTVRPLRPGYEAMLLVAGYVR